MQAVILAGGQGTRLQPFTDNAPKPMYPVQGRPFVDYLIEQLRDYGFNSILFLLGYKADVLLNHLRKTDYGDIDIESDVTPVEYDTGARIWAAKDKFEDEFLLMYCDNYCPIDLRAAFEKFEKSNNLIQISAYANTDGYTKNNILVEDDKVIKYDKKRKEIDLNAVDIGYAFMKKEVLSFLKDTGANFEAQVYPTVVKTGEMGVIVTEHRYYSIGSWDRMRLTEEFFRDRKVVFLDRDGTVNVRPPRARYVTKPEEFIWLPGAIDAIGLLKENGYEIYFISNQPGIARGAMTEEDLRFVNEKMFSDLQENNITIDGIYYCPHGWDEGCECRKPKPGMIFQAQKEHSLNLSKCMLIGDDERDIEAGEAAGISRNILVGEDYGLMEAVRDILCI